MVGFKDLWASVVVDGHRLVEYDENSDETTYTFRKSNAIVKYVEVTSGTRFQVEFGWDSLPKGCKGLVFILNLDGKYMDSAVCGPEHPKSTGYYLEGARRCNSGQWTEEKFRFAKIVSGTI